MRIRSDLKVQSAQKTIRIAWAMQHAWEKHNSIAHLSCASQTGYERVDHLDLARKQAIKRVKWTDVARSRGPKGQETNFDPNISEFQVKCVSSHKCLTKFLRKGKQSRPRFIQMSH